ncbi:MAG: hypothetical protein ACTHJ0_11005 [Flavipsychrobacter sp.]
MATSGYSSTPLFNKLGLKPGYTVKLINEPAHYRQLISEIAEQLVFTNKGKTNLDFIHFFTNSVSELQTQLPILQEQINKSGTIWVSWYKKSAGKATELTENSIRDFALAIGLVDVKVCAIDQDWSALKLVFRLKDR